MAFQLRRGTNTERLGITPVEGEIIYVTDSQVKHVVVTTITSGTVLTADETHNLEVGQALRYYNNSTNGFIENTVYYVLQDGYTETQFKLSLTKNGSPVTTFTNGTGLTIQIARSPNDAYGIPYGYSINPIWAGDGVTVGGLPAGAATLDELSDVTIGIKDQAGIALDQYQHIQYDDTTNQWRNVNDMTVPGFVNVLSTTDSSSSTTGSIKTAGGLGVAKTAVVGGKLFVSNSTDSTSKDTGALVVNNGGVGVELAVNAGTSITAGTSLSAGTSVSAGTTVTAGGNITAGGDVAVNGGDITTTSGTFNIASSATNINLGGTTKTTVAGDIQINGDKIRASDGLVNIVLDSNLSTNLQGDLKINGGDIKDVSGTTTISLTGSGNVTVAGDLKISGNDIVSSSNQTAITLSGNNVSMPNDLTVGREINLTGSQPFVNFNISNSQDGVNLMRGIRGQVTVDDYWFVGGGSTGDDDGYLLLAVSDNGNDANSGEQIIVRKYGGTGTSHNTPWDTSTPIVAELKLLDINSNTSIPNSLTVGAGLTVDTDTLIVNATNNYVGIGIEPTVKLDVNGSARIRGTSLTVDGNLIVNGTTTTINSTTLSVDDKNIELGSVVGYSDLTADGGGITLKGTTDKTILWENAYDWWNFNQSIYAPKAYFANLQFANSDNNTISTASGDLNLTATGQVNVLKDLEVQGNFKTYDNFIRLNSDVVDVAPSENCGITIARGTSSDVYIRWNETADRWQTTVDGTNYITIPNQNLDTTSVVTFDSANIGNVKIAVDSDNTISCSGALLSLSHGTEIDITAPEIAVNGWLNTTGSLSVNGHVELGYPNSGQTIGLYGEVNSNLTFAQPVSGTRGVVFKAGGSDFATVRGGQTGTDAGYLEIATGDNGNEPIYVKQYPTYNDFANGTNATSTLILLDNNGNTHIPNQLTVGGVSVLDTDLVINDGINYDSTYRTDTRTLTTTSTSAQTLDSNDITLFRTVKYVVSAESAGETHAVEVLMTHNGTTAVMTTYAEIYTDAPLFSLSCDVNTGYARLRVTAASATSTDIVASRIAFNKA